jgi:hypothetical protein
MRGDECLAQLKDTGESGEGIAATSAPRARPQRSARRNRMLLYGEEQTSENKAIGVHSRRDSHFGEGNSMLSLVLPPPVFIRRLANLITFKKQHLRNALVGVNLGG